MQEKKLRDALKKIAWRALEPSMRTIAKEALASTTEETEMEKLVAWLKRERDDSVEKLNKARDREWRREPVPEMERPAEYHAGQGNFCGYALNYITTQFGEEEGDAADREGD